MPFDGSGNYTLSDTIAPATNADANELQAILTDMQNAIDMCLPTDGQGTMTGVLKGTDGSNSAPMYSFSADTNSGFYRIGSDNIGLSLGGTKRIDFGTAGTAITGTFDATSYVDPARVLSTDAGAGSGPALDLYRNSASPADNDFIGRIDFSGQDESGNKDTYARILAQITDATNGTEDAVVYLSVMVGGVLTAVLTSSGANIAIPGNLGVTGDVAVNTNKLTVTASSGDITSAGAVSGVTVAGSMVANQAQQEAASATDKIVTPGTQQLHPSAAKAWVRFNGTGTVSIGASYNVTSVTDNGVGKYTLNFTIGFSSSQFAAVGNANLAGTFAVGDVLVVSCIPNAQSTCQVLVSDNNADTLTDPAICSVICTGDQ